MKIRLLFCSKYIILNHNSQTEKEVYSMGEKMSLASMEKRFFEREDISNQNFDLNYCIPINVGVISQTLVEQSYDQKAVEKALKQEKERQPESVEFTCS